MTRPSPSPTTQGDQISRNKAQQETWPNDQGVTNCGLCSVRFAPSIRPRFRPAPSLVPAPTTLPRADEPRTGWAVLNDGPTVPSLVETLGCDGNQLRNRTGHLPRLPCSFLNGVKHSTNGENHGSFAEVSSSTYWSKDRTVFGTVSIDGGVSGQPARTRRCGYGMRAARSNTS